MQEKVSLYFNDAKSDKEYHAQLSAVGDGFCVTAQNGPRGGTLSQARKPSPPVEYAVAKKDYDALVKSKTKKGYSEGLAGIAFVGGDLEERYTGIVPQLLNAISGGEEKKYLADPDWVLQEKHDGHRRLAQVTAKAVIGINRKGLVTGMPQSTLDAITVLRADPDLGEAVFDGELMGDVYALFDVLEIGGKDIRDWPLSKRLVVQEKLKARLEEAGCPGMFGVYTAYTESDKRRLYTVLILNGAEGGVFKRLDSTYVPGRPNSGGPQLKRKFTHRATFIVSKLHASKSSVHLMGLDSDGTEVDLGKCTVPANQAMPKAGALLDVEYLYAYRGGALCQPQFIRLRDDIVRADCTLAQLHYKEKTGDEELGTEEA